MINYVTESLFSEKNALRNKEKKNWRLIVRIPGIGNDSRFEKKNIYEK